MQEEKQAKVPLLMEYSMINYEASMMINNILYDV